MENICEFFIRLVELLEAEARSLRAGMMRLGTGLTVIAVAGGLLLAGAGLTIWAFYQWLSWYFVPAGAACVTGVCTLLVSGALLWLAARIVR